MGEKTIDRPLRHIIDSMMQWTNNPKMSPQLKRDIEKLCAAARASKFYEEDV